MPSQPDWRSWPGVASLAKNKYGEQFVHFLFSHDPITAMGQRATFRTYRPPSDESLGDLSRIFNSVL